VDWVRALLIASFAMVTVWCLLRPALRARHASDDDHLLAVFDLADTLRYYEDVLGFSQAWRWQGGERYGGINRDDVRVMFSQAPELASRVRRAPVFLEVDDIESLYDEHRARGARVIDSLEERGFGRSYAVEDINGYALHFVERDVSRAPAPGFILRGPRARATQTP
jgi:catechol 2,3-dioxygenase-like lactoylglutathione lyase family enzyme